MLKSSTWFKIYIISIIIYNLVYLIFEPISSIRISVSASMIFGFFYGYKLGVRKINE